MRAADALGVDVIQQCEVTGIRIEDGAVAGVDTTRGFIATAKLGLAVAGHSGRLAAMAGIALPIESHALQAMVSEPVKPVLDTVVTSGAVHFYISQSDKGELVMGGDLDFCNSYAQRGNLPIIENVVSACLTLFPSFGRLKLMRTWGGVCDMTMDGSPIIGKLPVKGLYMTGGWCYGGFKATLLPAGCTRIRSHATRRIRSTPHSRSSDSQRADDRRKGRGSLRMGTLGTRCC
jgi:sarcosine oxidase subunit beta